jgi:hypothetical protein
MVQKYGFVPLKQKPILYLTDDVLLAFCLLVLLGDGFIDILLFGFVGIAGVDHRDLLIVYVIGHL